MAPTLVWLYKNAPGDELRYSIRSLTETLPHDGVLIVGDKPDWYRGDFLKVPTGGVHARTSNDNTWNALGAVAQSRVVGEDFLLLNDDMFCMRKQRSVTAFHRGTLDDLLARLSREHPSSRYTAMLRRVRHILASEGVTGGYDYETHTPMPMTKDGILDTLEVRQKHPNQQVSKRSLYGNLNSVPAKLMPGPIPGELDCKVRGTNGPMPTGVWLSSTEQSFKDRLKPIVHKRFPEPSKYERS